MRSLLSVFAFFAWTLPLFAAADALTTTAAVITFQDCGHAGMVPHMTIEPGYGMVVAKIRIGDTTLDARPYTARLEVLKELCSKVGLRTSPSLQLTIEGLSPFGSGQITKAIAACPEGQAIDPVQGCLPIIGNCEGGVLIGRTASNGGVIFSSCAPQFKSE